MARPCILTTPSLYPLSTEMKEAAAEDRALVGDLSGATRTLLSWKSFISRR